MKAQIAVDNITCEGCAGAIKRALKALPEIIDVEVDSGTALVSVTYADNFSLEKIKQKLADLGYPEKKNMEAVKDASDTNYVSCVMEKKSEDDK